MSDQSEKGRAKTLGTFKLLCNCLTSFRPQYNPTNSLLLPENMVFKYVASQGHLAAFNAAEGPYKAIVRTRRLAFVPVSKLLTRLRASVLSSGLTQDQQLETVAQLDTLIRKYRGIASPDTAAKNKELEQKALEAGRSIDDLPDPVSVAQTSYLEKANTLQRVSILLANTADYGTNEADLSIDALNMLQQTLAQLNENAGEAIVTFQITRSRLRESFDTPAIGLVDLAFAAKEAVKMSFGTDSEQYKQVSGFSFPRERDQ